MGLDGDERSDIELIHAFSGGDEQGFETLYHRYRKQLYGYLNNMMPGNGSEADEVFEETWLRVIEKLPRYRDDGKFSAWLFRLSRNIFIDRLRKNKSGRFLPVDAEDAPELPSDRDFPPDREAGVSDLGAVIGRALETLPPDQKEVFLLREEDLSFKEIAEIQKCSLNTVLSRMRYALRSLRNFLSAIDAGGLLK